MHRRGKIDLEKSQNKIMSKIIEGMHEYYNAQFLKSEFKNNELHLYFIDNSKKEFNIKINAKCEIYALNF